MKSRFLIHPQIAFWGICLIVITWLAATMLFEIRMGMPANYVQWIKRAIGWTIELWLARALFLGARRHVSKAE